MKVIFNISENKNKATFQQEVVKINTSFNQTENIVKPKFQIGYYPLPVGLENYYTKNETDLLLENYYLKTETYSQDEVDGFLNLKADLSLLNNYYTETEINNKLQLKQNLPTGYVTGLQLSIHPTDNTKAIIGIGAYIITDFSDLENITATLVQVTEPIEFTPAYLTTSPSSYIALDINKNVIQSAIPFDNADRRTFCLVGNVVHSNLTNINVVNEIKAPIIAPTNQLHDLIKAVGFLNLEGNLISPNGSNLSLNKSAGKIWGLGINGGDYLDPHRLTLPEQTAITFRYRLSVSPLVESADRVILDPTQFEPNGGGVLSPLSNNNRWSVQHLNIFQSGVVRVQYGQHEYDSFVKARNAAFTEQFVTEQNIADNAIFRCYIIMKKTCTNLQLDITNGEAEIIHIGKFGNAVGGSNASLTLSNILAVLGYTPENVANKSDSYTASSSTTYASTKALVDGLATKLDKGTYTGTASDLVPYDGATQNVNIGAHYFESSQGFKKTGGTSNQALTADGSVFDLTTKADLIGGKVPSSQLPAYVDDVLEFANLASFPATGESGKIYIAIDTNVTYRWTGTGYAEISASLALGETSSTAYRGDRGKIAFDHSQTIGNPHGTTKAQVGLGNVDNTSDLDKPISILTQLALDNKVNKNPEIVSSTKTKVTYDSKGLVIAGDDATTIDINDSIDRRYVTDVQLNTIQNTSGINTGDETTLSIQIKRPLKTIKGESLEGVGNINLTKDDVGLSNVDNTSDANKPISTATQTALDLKVDKVAGKQLSTEDYTTSEKNKLAGIQSGAEVNVNADWNAISGDAHILNKPSTFTPSAHTHPISQVDNLQTTLDAKADLVNGLVPASQLPSFVNDVLEFSTIGDFPTNGETDKIYLAKDTNKIYRWSGSEYVQVNGGLALGETSETAYRGDRGKTAYDHSQTIGNPHGTTKGDIGLGNVPNVDATNPANITQSASYRFVTDTEKATWNAKQNALTNPITGTGTTNYLPKFITAGTLGNSIIYDNGTNVGIGTTSPNAKLSINGTTQITSGSIQGGNSLQLYFANNIGYITAYDAGVDWRDLDYNSKNHIFRTLDFERMRITSSGNVGIGTTNPTDLLHLFKSSYPVLTISSGTVTGNMGIDTLSNFLNVGTTTNHPIIFATNNSERMRITSGGNVGIGTTSPSYPLHVGTQVSNISIYAAYDIVAFSDKSVKENIRPIENVIERIQNSRGVVYDRIDSGEKDNIGFIAQELEEQFPELIVENPDGTKAVKYQNAVAILFEAIKEQQKQINELRNGITD